MRRRTRFLPAATAFALSVGLLAAAAGPLSSAAADTPAPLRVVSTNVCIDQLVLLLADREQIAALSYAAANPAQSAMAEAAAGYPLLYGHAEEILPLEPDLIFAGNFTARPAIALLQRFGYRIVEVPDALTLEDIRSGIRTVAAALGHRTRGEAMIADFDARIAAAAPPEDGRLPEVAFLSQGLYAAAEGTLVDDLLKATGLGNAATGWGVSFIGPVNLEALLLDPPDGLVLGPPSDREPSLSQAVLSHPAMEAVKRQVEVAYVPGTAWVCGTPMVAGVVEELAALRAAIVAKEP